MNKKYNSATSIIIATILGITIIFTAAQQSFSQTEEKKVLKIGYFPNINHAQAVIGIGNGDFQKVLGANVEIKPFIFNAGPSAIEALFAKQVDVTYVGPNPAINGYVISEGKDVRIISGATSGGAIFVIRSDSGINSPSDFADKKFGSPQLGNTQDVALRNYLLEQRIQDSRKSRECPYITILTDGDHRRQRRAARRAAGPLPAGRPRWRHACSQPACAGKPCHGGFRLPFIPTGFAA